MNIEADGTHELNIEAAGTHDLNLESDVTHTHSSLIIYLTDSCFVGFKKKNNMLFKLNLVKILSENFKFLSKRAYVSKICYLKNTYTGKNQWINETF